MVDAATWQFWIDVGGTFTDCLGRRPDGQMVSHKILSSGVYKSRGLAGSSTSILRFNGDGFPDGFLDGYEVTFAGAPADLRVLKHSQTELHLSATLREPLRDDVAFELKSSTPAPVAAIRFLMKLPAAQEVGAVSVRLGTTRGTNALLTRTGARVAFVTTKGFGDVLAIGTQNRPDLFALNIRQATPLYETVVEVDERIAIDGEVLTPLMASPLKTELTRLRASGIEAIAICFLNAYRHPTHEEMAAKIATDVGFMHVSVSSRLAPLQRIVSRGDTTVVDAYLTPVIRSYVDEVRRALPDADLSLMTSAGALVAANAFVGKDSILSGPAGGVVGVARIAREGGYAKVIGFDMGGTSTDVCRFDGTFERRYEMELRDAKSKTSVKIVAPMLAVETVAAGGGSICAFDGLSLTVGPESAGAEPGPACYGKAGPLTITDCNLVLGRLSPKHFAFAPDTNAAERRLDEVLSRIGPSRANKEARTQLAEGFLAVAASAMALPMKRISVGRGFDVRDHTLVSFGGAGAQHACQVADELGIRDIVQHPYASLLSAFGIGMAEVRKFVASDVGKPLNAETLASLEIYFSEQRQQLERALRQEAGSLNARLVETRLLDLRYLGQDTAISIARPDDDDWSRAFATAHRECYGFAYPERTIEVRAARLELAAAKDLPLPAKEYGQTHAATPIDTVWATFRSREQLVPLFDAATLAVGATLVGPALVVGDGTLIVVEVDWTATFSPERHLVLSRKGDVPKQFIEAQGTPDPVNLALFQNQFTSIAEQMGATLRRTAVSVNIKERLDFSCAIFGADGSLVVNAPHIPVHLGSMGDTVRAVIGEAGATLKPGDVFVTNDPYRGGSHLPDVTVVTPVFSDDGQRLLFFTGNRAHHAEIGGTSPGSMPPDAKTLADEGVLIRCRRLVSDGVSLASDMATLFASGPYPSRAPKDNLADLSAQVAANELGRRQLLELVERRGEGAVAAYVTHIQDAAERRMRQALATMKPGRYVFSDALDDGTPLVVAIVIATKDGKPAVTCDFTGSGPVSPGNLNANLAIVKAATLYVFRCLIDADIPLNEGVLKPVTFIIPTPSILAPPLGDDPTTLAAVNAGNVETSQRLVDILLGALGLAAASQGTMNNVLFGRAATATQSGFGYYETVGGGAGAGEGFVGASGVHTHMTNTRITDAEVLEERFPVRVRRFSLRPGSGGAGAFRGGDGLVRELEFLEPLQLSLITSRRTTAPYGLAGGASGKAGKNTLVRGTHETTLGSMASVAVEAGDRLILETPGGGGYGVRHLS